MADNWVNVINFKMGKKEVFTGFDFPRETKGKERLVAALVLTGKGR